jgi:CelD/BcsL family acetyltransferase involved in cellulose biosynthesis
MEPLVSRLGMRTSLKILYATEGDKVVAIAPLRKTRRGLAGKFGYAVIEPLAKGNTDYSGIIIGEQDKESLFQLLSYLFNQKDWDLFYFPDLPESSQVLELLNRVHESLPGFEIENGWVCPYLEIPESKEKLLANLNPTFRRGLRRQLRKLKREQGRVELKYYYEMGSLEQAMEILFRLHQKRWKLKGEAGVFESQDARDVSMETSKLFDQKNWFRLYFLTVNDKPVAANLSLEYKKKMYGHLVGFDPDYSRYGVGCLLQLKVLEECIAEGISEYDFMQGAEPYKFNWTSKYRQSKNVRFINKKLSSNVINLLIQNLHMPTLIPKMFQGIGKQLNSN